MIEIVQNFTDNLHTTGFSLLLILASFLGGVIASLSPCTLGVIPIIMGYVGGYEKEKSPYKTFIKLLSFVFGLSCVLTVVGIFCALTGKVFMAIGGEYWVVFMASLIMIFALNLLGLVEIPIPHFVKRMPKSNGASNFLYPFALGSLFALASTPCSTPILASIMSFASLSSNILQAAILLLAFSLGQGLIMVVAGLFTSIIKNVRGMNRYSEILMKLCGVLLLISSLFLFYKVFSPFFIN